MVTRNSSAGYTVTFTIRMEPSLYDKLKALSAKECRSANSQACIFLRDAVAQYEKDHGILKQDS